MLSLCTTICLFSSDADLQTLPHITHTVLSGLCGTLDDDGLSMWDFIWFTYPSFERRTRPHVSQIQFAWLHDKFSRFSFLITLFSFARSNLLTWRELQPFFTNSRQAPRSTAVASQVSVMANGIRTGDPRGFNKGRSSKFREGSRVRQTPEEGRRTYRPKRCGNNNKDEDNSPKNLNDKNQLALSQKFRQPISHKVINFI